MSCRLWPSCMAATAVLVVAGADGGGSCGDGPAAPTPISTAEIKIKIRGNLTAAATSSTRPGRWDVTGVCVMQNWKAPRWLFQGEHTPTPENVVDLYIDIRIFRGDAIHHSHWLLPSYMPDWPPNPPGSILYPRFAVGSLDLTIFCACLHARMFVLYVHLRQDSKAVEDQWEGQASRGL